MLTITVISPDLIHMELNGTPSADEMRAAIDDFLKKTQAIEHGRMLYRLEHFDFPSLVDAIGVKLSQLPKLFRAFFLCPGNQRL